MSSESFVTSDLRRAGTEVKRDHDHKAKWAHGGRSAQFGQSLVPPPIFPVVRPTKGRNIGTTRALRSENQHNLNQLARGAKTALRYDIREVLDNGPSDSSSGEEVDPASAVVVMEGTHDEEDVLLPYAVTGQTIFVAAVDKAVEKFETKETEKLVKEYEVISRESEMSIGYLADGDDFELVDYVQL